VEYSRDPEFHMSLKRETEAVKTIVRKKGGAAALRAQNSAAATPGEGSGDPQTPLSRGDGANDASRTSHHATVPPEEDRAPSPASSTSSGSEPPLAMRVKLNGTNHGGAAPHSAPLDRVATPKRNASQPLESRAPTSAPSKPSWVCL
jgi:SWI/SNF-related matrix-associated actin-dependent regulator of chromatin subfamily B protein 1